MRWDLGIVDSCCAILGSLSSTTLASVSTVDCTGFLTDVVEKASFCSWNHDPTSYPCGVKAGSATPVHIGSHSISECLYTLIIIDLSLLLSSSRSGAIYQHVHIHYRHSLIYLLGIGMKHQTQHQEIATPLSRQPAVWKVALKRLQNWTKVMEYDRSQPSIDIIDSFC